MRYFQEVEASELCSISEAAAWIAYGLLPDVTHGLDRNDKPIDERESVEQILENMGSHFAADLYFGESFLQDFFPMIDSKSYVSAYEVCGGDSPEICEQYIYHEIELNKQLLNALEGKGSIDHIKVKHSEHLSELKEQLVSAIRLRELQSPILHRLRAARGKLFLSLINEEIASRGVPIPKSDAEIENWEADDWPDSFIEIPSIDWNMEGIDWFKSNLTFCSGRYLGIIVSTRDLLLKYPRPDILNKKLEGELYGLTQIVESNKSEYGLPEMGRQKRGAPHRTDRILEAAIHSHLNDLQVAGTLGQKQEGRLAAISDFVQRSLGQEIPRSTAQRILTRWK